MHDDSACEESQRLCNDRREADDPSGRGTGAASCSSFARNAPHIPTTSDGRPVTVEIELAHDLSKVRL